MLPFFAGKKQKKKKEISRVWSFSRSTWTGPYASLYSCIPSYEPKLTVSFWNSHHYGFWLLSLSLYKSFCRIHPSLLKQGMAKFNWSIFKFFFFVLIPYWLIAIPQNIHFFLINSLRAHGFLSLSLALTLSYEMTKMSSPIL